MKSLAVLASVILGIAILGGPIALGLSRIKARTKVTAYLIRGVVSLLSFATMIMGFALVVSTLSMAIKIIGVVGMATAFLALYRTFKRKPESWR